jgi:hypothetical protein
MEKKTVKYHIPQHGIYMYARTNSGKTELIVLNSTDAEQVVANDGSPDKPGGLSIQLCKSEKKEFYIRYSS